MAYISKITLPSGDTYNLKDCRVPDNAKFTDTTVIENQNGKFITFDGASSKPIQKLITSIDPVQTGVGDPSSTNIRPITGWTSAKIFCSGKNLYNKNDPAYSFRYNSSTGKIANSNNARSIVIPCKPNMTYTVSKIPASRFSVCYTTTIPAIDVNCYGGIEDYTASHITITTGADAAYLVAYVWLSTEDSSQVSFSEMQASIQIELGNIASKYEEYISPNIYMITFPALAGMVYGGTLNIVNKILTVTYKEIVSYAGETLPGKWISDRDIYISNTSPTVGAQVVYELSTPENYTVEEIYSFYTPDWFYSKRINTNSDIGSTIDTNPVDSSIYDSALIPVVSGDSFILTGRCGASMPLWAFIDNNKILLSKSDLNINVTNLKLTATSDGYLVLNCYNSYPYELFKKTLSNIETISGYNSIYENCGDILDSEIVTRLGWNYAEYIQTFRMNNGTLQYLNDGVWTDVFGSATGVNF